MHAKTLARWLVLVALVCFGLFLAAGIASAQEGNVIQGQNGSEDSAATSEDASASNELTFQAGPGAFGDGDVAQAAQVGDNIGSYSQDATARSGDASAGSTIAGVAGSGATLQLQNSSEGAEAESEDATASNEGEIFLGPRAESGDSEAQASQVGDNRLDASQTVSAESGDAVAGSQVAGVAGDGDHTVQQSNVSEDAETESGDVDASNELELTVGPFAEAGDELAQASQVGDNDAVWRQDTDARSGDAVAGSTVTGIVGDGSSTSQGQSASEDAEAESGDVSVQNQAEAVIGPSAVSDGASAAAQQTGNNSVDVEQALEAGSGDAIAGSQVTGLVTEEAGHLTVQNQQSSEDDTAESGDITAENEIEDLWIGPHADAGDEPAQAQQNGDNDVSINQAASLWTGDALAGAQVTGAVADGDTTIQNQNISEDSLSESGDIELNEANQIEDVVVGPNAESEDAEAQASQVGDNSLSIDQSADVATGDAVAGSQVTGVIGQGDTTIQGSNASEEAEAFSGEVEVDAVNVVNDVNVGPHAEADEEAATASQVGDNAVAISQDATLQTGDALAGSQVTGVVVDPADVTIQNQNTSDEDEAETGDIEVDVVNVVDRTVVGPSAESEDAPAQASQVGDNAVAIDQAADLATGDAVAGSQVTGVVANEGSVTVQNQNDSEENEAESGEIDADNINEIENLQVGPRAESEDAAAAATQNGDNVVAIGQDATLQTGDAVAGGQVSGVVADSSDVTVQNQNVTEESEAESGEIDIEDAVNSVENTFVGPSAEVDEDEPATAAQVGDNTVAFDQAAEASTGDAVAGGQVTGVVAEGGSATIQNQNASEEEEATSGEIDVENVNEIEETFIGPSALSDEETAQASQTGNNDAEISQAAVLATGDALAGAQVTGVVIDPSDVTIQNQNTSEESEAESGDIETSEINTVEDVFIGPRAESDDSTAAASQVGDNSLVLDQSADLSTGDAVAGSQVTGVVAEDGDVTIQNQNDSEDAEAETGDATAQNEAEDIFVGPLALGDGDPASAAQVGDNSLDLSQDATASTGDAVAGAQVVGATSDDSTVQLQNTDEDSEAESSDADVENEAEGNVGPFASSTSGTASAQQNGDSGLTADQTGEASTGDVVAGGQVLGLAGFGAAALSTESGVVQDAASGDGSFSVGSAAAA